MTNSLLRQLPKIETLLALPALAEACDRYPYPLVRRAAQTCVDRLRRRILAGLDDSVPPAGEIAALAVQLLAGEAFFSLRRVINATGVVLHTNLGRAPLGQEVAEHVARVAAGYSNLEYDTEAGARGSRYSHVEGLLCSITGAEAAMVVNNNAGAVFLALNTLAKGETVAVSRGELVEIGGSFRVPEIMRESGAVLMEVGTTNKTHPEDYRRALENGASVLLKVHTSNFRVVGFTEEVALEALCGIARERGALVLYDLGAGFLFPSETLGLANAGHVVSKCVRSGADLICFSGDKLLGSAQAGILLGKKELIEQIRKNPLTRMLRIDKLSLAALEMTLHYSVDAVLERERIPTLRLLAKSAQTCRDEARELKAALAAAAIPGLRAELVPVEDEAGGGALPGVTLPGAALALRLDGVRPEALGKSLRQRAIPIIARIGGEQVLLSARTLLPGDAEEIVRALTECAAECGGRAK